MVRMLVALGAIVVATDIAKKSPFGKLPTVVYASCDLTDEFSIRNLFFGAEYEYIFHVAGLFDYSASNEMLHKVNVGGSLNLMRAVHAYSILPKRFVFWGDGGVYDFAIGKRGQVAKEGQFIGGKEVGGTPITKLTGYLKSKHEAEMSLFSEAEKLGIAMTSLRPGSVYGPGSWHGITAVLKLAAAGGLGPFYIGPQQTRAGMVHVEDVCRAALFVANRFGSEGQIYNVSDDSSHTTAYLMRKCSSRLGFPMLPFVSLPIGVMKMFAGHLERRAAKLGRVSSLTPDTIALQERDSILDTSKIKQLGWTPRHPDTLVGLLETISEPQK